MYAELILPLALSESYHYRLDLFEGSTTEMLVGRRALVSFGPKRFYTGIIASVSHQPPPDLSGKQLKAIDRLLDDRPIVSQVELDFWRWVADYYHCTLGQVMRTALPSGLLPESKTLIYLNPDFSAGEGLTSQDYLFLDALQSEGERGLSLQSLQSRLGRTSLTASYHRLLALGAIHTEETILCRYRPRMRAYLRLGEEYRSCEGVERAYELLRRSKRQQEVLADFLNALEDAQLGFADSLARQSISQNDSGRMALLRKLIERGILEVVEQAESRLEQDSKQSPRVGREVVGQALLVLPKTLNYLSLSNVKDKQLATIQLVAQYIRAGKQVLLLSPSVQDMPSAADFLQALERAAEGRLYHYHPQTSEDKRTELFRLLSTSTAPCLILGTRSAVFLPLHHLGLIIVDEEQEYMYKQQHIAPYYHARDIALYIAQTRGVQLLLTSATPSAEATFNMLRGKYHLLDYPSAPIRSHELPILKLIDTATLRHKRQMSPESSISKPLQVLIGQTLARGERVLLLQNRRGYAHHLHCKVCGQSINCPRCSVSLNYYASDRQLRCLYCSYVQPLPNVCPHCLAAQVESPQGLKPALHLVGFGAERVEEELVELFPDSRIMRLDSDSLQSAKRRSELHARIASGDVDIIIGTQLIKAQPIWDNIGLVAVVQLESLISKADFRNGERVYQLLYQLMLHTRHEGQASDCIFAIQTNDLEHPFLTQLGERDYKSFIKAELRARQLTHFPPFTRMSTITLKGFDETLVVESGQMLVLYLRQHLEGIELSDLSAPSITRIDGQYIRQIVCRRPYNLPYHQERKAMTLAEQQLRYYMPTSRRVQIYYDIDPL